MWQAFIDWLKGLFGSEDSSSFEDPVEELDDQTFAGWIKDEPDARDQIFGETK